MTHAADHNSPRFYEDFEVGHRFTTGKHALDVEQIKTFARQFDPQPFHLDEEAAKDSLFGGLAASGWHTMGITMRLIVEGGAPVAGGIVGGGCTVDWPTATRPGDILQVVSEVIEMRTLRSRADLGMVTMRNETTNQRGEMVQVFVAKLFVPRKGGGSEQGSAATPE